MAAVAERFVLRRAAPAERNPRVLSEQLAVLAEDPDLAADEQRPVGALLHRGLLRHWLLRPAVPTAEVQRSRRAALDHLADLVGRSVIDDDPGPPLAVEYGREPAQALGDVDTECRLPGDLDPVVRVACARRPTRSAAARESPRVRRPAPREPTRCFVRSSSGPPRLGLQTQSGHNRALTALATLVARSPRSGSGTVGALRRPGGDRGARPRPPRGPPARTAMQITGIR